MRRLALVCGLVALLLACGTVEGPGALGPSPSAIASKLPQPIAQPITRKDPGAQVAWVWTYAGEKRWLVAVDPAGAIVAQLDDVALASARAFWRSADGATIFLAGASDVRAYSALGGKLQRTYVNPASPPIASAFSADGRWLAVLSSGPSPRLAIVDLRSGATQTVPIAHDPNAALPGLSGQIANTIWGTVAFGPDSASLYVLTDWGGPARITAFALANDQLRQTATVVDGQSGRIPSCAGPAVAATVSARANALVVFCHVDGAVWLVDPANLANVTVVQADQPNPFWLSPIFTPDGQLLYLHQAPTFGDKMQVVDLVSRKLLGPVTTPTHVGDAGPFSWRMPVAYAGGTASTMPVSPDGLKLYSGTADGVAVLRIPDLKPLARLAPGVSVDEIWVSGDGRTLYATADAGKRLAVIAEDGSAVKIVTPPAQMGGFIASERG